MSSCYWLTERFPPATYVLSRDAFSQTFCTTRCFAHIKILFLSFFVVILDSDLCFFFLFWQFLPSTLPVISAQGREYGGCGAIVSAASPHVWLCSSSSSRATLRMCAHVRGTVLTAGWWRWWWRGGAGGGWRGVGWCLSVAAVSSVECLVVSHVAVNARNKGLLFWKSKRWNGALIHITCTGKCAYSLCIYEEAAHAGGLIWLAAGFSQRKHDLRFNSGFGSFFFSSPFTVWRSEDVNIFQDSSLNIFFPSFFVF